MRKTLKIELKKALCSKYFVLGLCLLMLFAILSAVYMIENRAGYNPDSINHYLKDGKLTRNPDLPLFGFYSAWIGGEDLSLAYILFYTLLPVGAALPFGWSYYTERKSGYLKNIASRIDKRTYLFSKAIATFAVGMLVVLLPLLVNVFLVSAFVPTCDPFAGYTFYNHVYFGNLWVDLYFTHPFLHMVLYILLDTLYGGIFALFSLAISFYLKNIFAVVFIPFLLMLVAGYVERIAITGFPDRIPIEFVPTQFLHASAAQAQVMGWAVILVTLLILGFSLLTVGIRGSKDEIF